MANDKTLAGIMYVLNIVGIFGVVADVVIWAMKREDKFIDFHFKQLLVLWICGLILALFWLIPVLGWIIAIIGSIGLFIIWILGMISAFKGEKKELYYIGKYASKFKF